MTETVPYISKLPQDVLDEIISWLPALAGKYGRDCSREAALVCKSWLSPARRNLFNCTKLNIHEDRTSSLLHLLESVERSEDIVKNMRTVHWTKRSLLRRNRSIGFNEQFPEQTLERLAHVTREHNINHTLDLQMLRDVEPALFFMQVFDRVPELAYHVTRINWHCVLSHDNHFDDHAGIILRLLQRLPALSHLDLRLHHFNETPLPVDSLLNGHITFLYLSSATFSTEIAFCSFLSSLTNLSHVRLDSIEIVTSTSPGHRELQAIETNALLRRVDIDSFTPASIAFMRWLELEGSLAKLLELKLPGEGPVVSFPAQLSAVETLQIYYQPEWMKSLQVSTEYVPIDLSACARLSHLEVTTSAPESLHLISTTLESVTSPVLSSLRLTIFNMQGSDDHWVLLRNALDRPPFATLSMLYISIPQKDQGDESVRRARTELSGVISRGNVCFDSRGPNADFMELMTKQMKRLQTEQRKLSERVSTILAPVKSWFSRLTSAL